MIVEISSEFKEYEVDGKNRYHDYHQLTRHRYSILGTISGYGRRWFVKSLIPEIADSSSAIRSLKKEFEILLTLSHPGIVRAIELIDIPEVGPSIILEYIEGYTLDKVPKMSAVQRRALALQLIDALEYLHSKGVTHGDLKPENIMVKSHPSTHPSLKIIDFNLADSEEYTFDKEAGGNRKYAAPEQFDPGYRLCPSADVYSLGLLLEELNLGITWKNAIRKSLRKNPSRRLPDASAIKLQYNNDKKNVRILISFLFLICSVLLLFVFLLPSANSENKESLTAAPATNQKQVNDPEELTPNDVNSGILAPETPGVKTPENVMLPNSGEKIEKVVDKASTDKSEFEFLDSLRKVKETQIKQIFKQCKQEISAIASDTSLSASQKNNKITNLYMASYDKAVNRFGEFVYQCPPEKIMNPPEEWKYFLSQADFIDFSSFVGSIKESL